MNVHSTYAKNACMEKVRCKPEMRMDLCGR